MSPTLRDLGVYAAEFLVQIAALTFVVVAVLLYVRELVRPAQRRSR